MGSVTDSLTLYLDGYHGKGLNWQRRRHHWAVFDKEKRLAYERLFIALAESENPDFKAKGNLRVRYTRIRRAGPPMDDDNLSASFKDLGDAIQKIGIIGNDRYIDLIPDQKTTSASGMGWGTLLILEDCL